MSELLERKQAAATLRETADKIEKGELVLNSRGEIQQSQNLSLGAITAQPIRELVKPSAKHVARFDYENAVPDEIWRIKYKAIGQPSTSTLYIAKHDFGGNLVFDNGHTLDATDWNIEWGRLVPVPPVGSPGEVVPTSESVRGDVWDFTYKGKHYRALVCSPWYRGNVFVTPARHFDIDDRGIENARRIISADETRHLGWNRD